MSPCGEGMSPCFIKWKNGFSKERKRRFIWEPISSELQFFRQSLRRENEIIYCLCWEFLEKINSMHQSWPVLNTTIPAQITIVRRTGESTGVQDQHHRVFINRHAPLSMLTKVEVLSIWYLIALQRHVLITYINFAGVMREDFFSSFAWKILFAAQLTRIHTDTHTPLKRAMPFSYLANHSSYTISLNGFSRPGYVCKNVECKTNSQPVKTHSWTERWQAGGAQLSPWGPLCFFLLQINCFVCALIDLV